MSVVAFSYWWKFKNELPYTEERIWSEYVNDKEAFERKISLRKNKLLFAMGFGNQFGLLITYGVYSIRR
jgi:hypothetical protein